jgi:hypothetical protein
MANMISQSDASNQERGSQQESSGFANRVAQTTNEATSQTVQRLQQTRERLDKKLMDQRSSLVESVRNFGNVLDGAGKMLGEDDFGAHFLHYASDQVGRIASYVEDTEPSAVAEDLRGFARERPAWFFGGAFVLGLALGRFVHSSAAGSVGGASRPDQGMRAAGGRLATGSASSKRLSPSAQSERAPTTGGSGGFGSQQGGIGSQQGTSSQQGSTRPTRGSSSGQP